MHVKTSTFIAVNLVLLLILAGAAAVVGWLVLGSDVNLTDAEKTAKLNRLAASASIYYGRLNYYEGVCDDIGVPEGFTCNESGDAYALAVQLETGRYLCIDGQGFNAEIPYSLGNSTACQP